MEIQVNCRSQERKEFLESCTGFFIKELRLKHSKFALTINSRSNLRKNRNCNGEVYQSGYRTIDMALDSRLAMPRLLLTLAHEMVHVKQIAKGQYKGKLARNGRLLSCWRGVAIRAQYEDRPWEIEAFGRQEELVVKLLQYVVKKKNQKG